MQLHWCQCPRQVPDRGHGSAGVHVVQDEMALTESAALRILAGHSDRYSFGQERTERESFSMSPLNATTGAERTAPALELFFQLRMDRESFRPAVQLVIERSDELGAQ